MNNIRKLNTQDFCAITMVLLTIAIVILTKVLADVEKEQTQDNKNQIEELQKSTQADYELRFDEKLFSGDNLRIAIAIQRKRPILKINGKGEFEDYQLDLYLGALDQLNSIFKMGLISKELVYNNFCDDVDDAFKNKEVKDYLNQIRKEDSTYFTGFTELNEFCSSY